MSNKISRENFHWHKEDYFPYLIHNNKNSTLALEYLVDDLHNGKEITIETFLSHCGSEDFLWGLVKLMSYSDSRISGNSAYVLGTIAETENGTSRIIELLNNKTNKDAKNILLYMINMLKSTDAECLMNAAGTIGTISESKLGREWLLSQESLSEVIELCSQLLDHKNLWVSSNAALVLARISIDDIGCKALLYHEATNSTLKKLINSLGNDDAGRGMNCAFAIGRLCDYEEGREAFLNLNKDMNKLISTLTIMIEENHDYGCTKNACFALSCLAANEKAHAIIIKHDSFEKLINSLCKLIIKVNDTETQWFAAMLIRVLSSLPNGCVKIRALNIVDCTLKSLLEKSNLFIDVKEEIDITLELLKRLDKPCPPKIDKIDSSEIILKWDEVILKNKLIVQYKLYNGTNCVYSGQSTTYKLTNLDPFTNYVFQLQLCTLEDGDKSILSDPVEATTEESIPSEPLNLKCTGSTTTLLKIVWDPPEKLNGALKGYFIFNGQTQIDQTNELMYILTGLTPATSYEIQVCASTNKGKGAKASLLASTCELGDVSPEKPSFGPIGRREILIRWAPPQVIAGKLNKYELLMNGKSIYTGIALEYQMTMLKPDTEYKFEVIAITNEGKFKSKVAKARTLKDEYDPERAPLYPGPQNNQVSSAIVTSNEQNVIKKRVSQDVDRSILIQRKKTQLKITKEKAKEKITTIECEDFSSTSKQTLSENNYLPPVFVQNEEEMIHRTFLPNNSRNIIPRPVVSRSKENNFFHKNGSIHINKSFRTKSSKQNTLESIATKHTNYYSTFERSKTIGFTNKPINRGKTVNTTYPTPSSLIAVNVKELQPEFPSLQTNTILPYFNSISNNNSPSNENIKLTSPILSSSPTSTNIIDTQNDRNRLINNFVPMQYRYMIRRLQKERPIKLEEITAVMRANTFVSAGDQYRTTRLTK